MSNHRNASLSTTDAQGRRLWVYPADVKGRFRKRRSVFHGVLLFIFLAGPWFTIGGKPLLLLDFLNGRISIFGLEFWAHDAPMLLFVFGGAAISLAFVTSVWGRIWCGWACPQTVFIDAVFRRIERGIEGDSVKRRRLDHSPWTQQKLFKKTLKWILYAVISGIIAHSFLAYFIGTESLSQMMKHAPSENIGIFLAMLAITGLVLFDFGWFREQFCTLLCPYGRFQSVLMDDRSLAVAYDSKRKDCIDCKRCVQVCPTGIDIRDGLQLECIACTACIDACDAVMKKTRAPLGLIRYISGFSHVPTKQAFTRPLLYLAVLAVLMGSLIWTVHERKPVEISLIRAIGSPYEEVTRIGFEKEIVNHFKLDLLNQSFETVTVSLEKNLEHANIQIVSALMPATLKPGESRKVDFFVRFPNPRANAGLQRLSLETVARSPTSKTVFRKILEVPLVSP